MLKWFRHPGIMLALRKALLEAKGTYTLDLGEMLPSSGLREDRFFTNGGG